MYFCTLSVVRWYQWIITNQSLFQLVRTPYLRSVRMFFTVMITSLPHMVQTDFSRPRVLIQQKVYFCCFAEVLGSVVCYLFH